MLLPRRCKNTVQGRYTIADDKGRVCEWENVDGEGCCGQALPDSCKGCDLVRRLFNADRHAALAQHMSTVVRTVSVLPSPGIKLLLRVRVLRGLLPAVELH